MPAVPAHSTPTARLFVLLLPLLLACGEGVEVIQPPPPDSAGNDGGGDGGTVQRATLSLEVLVDTADAAVAAALGWDGVLPGAEVTLVRSASSDPPTTRTTGTSGHVQFIDLLPGTYGISIVRTLTEADRALLSVQDADVTGFGGGGQVTVEAPGVEERVTAVAGRRGSLVFSEIFPGAPATGEIAVYRFGHYIEVYNNSDTTLHLGGKVLALGISWLADYSSPRSCAEMERWRLDPEGIWTGYRYKFPGGPGAHALRPGAAAVVATDAINHTEFVAGLSDLSGADFEFIGTSGDVDNPAVPNMINMGPRVWASSLHPNGQYLPLGDQVWVLAEAVEESDLVRDNLPVVSPDHARIPAEAILDVFASDYVPEIRASLTPTCAEFVHQRFDRRFASLVDYHSLQPIVRRELTRLPEGRPLLQRTRTSARDFVKGLLRTPGEVP